MPESPRSQDEAGFTIVEALIAIVILAIGLTAVTNLLIVGASSNSVGNQMSATTAIASQELERLKSLPFTAAELQPGGNITADASVGAVPYFNEVVVDGVGPIHTRWQITAIAGDAQTRFVQVRSEPVSGLMRTQARAEFSTFRACTAIPLGCPNP